MPRHGTGTGFEGHYARRPSTGVVPPTSPRMLGGSFAFFFMCEFLVTAVLSFLLLHPFCVCIGQELNTVKQEMAQGLVSESEGKEKTRLLEEKVWFQTRRSLLRGGFVFFVFFWQHFLVTFYNIVLSAMQITATATML